MLVRAVQVRVSVTSTLLAISGVLTFAGSAQRWWPACRVGAFDSGRCPELQDSAYDYVAPSSPESLIGTAAELHGTGMLLLAVAVLLLPGLLNGRQPSRTLTFAATVMSAAVAFAALPTLISGLEGEVVSLPLMWLPWVLYLLGLPALLIVSAAGAAPAPGRVWLARWAVVNCLVVASNPLIQFFVAPAIFLYTSHDTTPWTEAIGGVLLIGASVFLWLTLHRDHAVRPVRTLLTAQAE